MNTNTNHKKVQIGQKNQKMRLKTKKLLLIGLFWLSFTALKAQTSNEKAIIACIDAFFAGMHQSDTSAIAGTLAQNCSLKSISVSNNGQTKVSTETTKGFLEQVAKLKGNKLEERLLDYHIKIDGPMAMAWTPYQFYFDEKLHHCGVNMFTLVLEDTTWHILSITDTRRRQPCN
jgi:hypothetical protein